MRRNHLKTQIWPLAASIGLLAPALVAMAHPAAAQTAGQSVNAGEVSAAGGGTGATIGTVVPTQQQILQSGETVRVLDQSQMQALGPVAGGAQALSLAPGAYVNGYGNTGSSKYTIALDGIGQGWGGYGGYTGGASLMITMDGIPMVDPVTGLWASSSIPQLGMFQATQVTYGPGQAVDRWYDNIGGNVEFTPLQPTAKAGGDINFSYGSYNQKNTNFDIRTGSIDGWSTIISGGLGDGDSYRTGADGFNNPGRNYSFYGKTVKQFAAGDISFGGYVGQATAYRPQVIPTDPNANITVNGLTPGGAVIPGTLYSQKTSGFYSTPPFDSYEKMDMNQVWMLYNKANLNINDTTTLHNMDYYASETRLHSRLYDAYPSNASNLQEYNDPSTYWYGDKLWVTEKLAYNTIDTGLSFLSATYNTKNAFYNPNDPYFGSRMDPNAKYRDGIFNQADMAAFIQDDFSPVSTLHITPGIRFVHYDVSYMNNSAFGFPNATGTDQGQLPNSSRQFNAPEPSIDINYQPAKWLALYGSYEEAYKTPQVGGGGGLYQQIPSQYAQLAHAREYQAGFKANLDAPQLGLRHFLFGANYFFLSYDKQTIDTALANGNQITAFGSSTYQGANFFFDDNPFLTAHLFANASIVNAVYTNYSTGSLTSPTVYQGLKVPYVPTSTFNIGADYKALSGEVVIDPSVWYQFTGSQNIFDNNIGAPSKQSLAAYGTLNMGVTANVPLQSLSTPDRQRTLTLSLDVLNVTNLRYNSYAYVSSGGYFGTPTGGYTLAYPGAPLTIYGSIGVSF